MIFSYGLAIGKFAKGSGDPLGAQTDFTDTQESETVILDGLDKPANGPTGDRRGGVGVGVGAGGNRERGTLSDDEIQAFSSMTDAVKEVSHAIRESKPTDMHPDRAVMDAVGFAEEDLMVALGHLVDNKA